MIICNFGKLCDIMVECHLELKLEFLINIFITVFTIPMSNQPEMIHGESP